jgi:hypothetical protein
MIIRTEIISGIPYLTFFVKYYIFRPARCLRFAKKIALIATKSEMRLINQGVCHHPDIFGVFDVHIMAQELESRKTFVNKTQLFSSKGTFSCS